MPFSKLSQGFQGYSDQRQRMLEAPIPPLVLTMAVPTVISMLVTALYNMADTYFVSQINTSASGAVGVVFSVMAMIQAVGFTVGMGSGSMVSRLLGQDKGEEANTVASSAVITALILGIALAGIGLFTIDSLIWLLGSTETIYPYAMDYARYILLGAPVMVVAFTLNNLLRWQGKASLSVFGLAIGGVLNIILDPIFIFTLDMGIGGAAIATLISQCVSVSILAAFFLLGHSQLKINLRYVATSPRIYLAILKQGMPSFFRQGILGASTMALNWNARLFGDAAVAALAIVGKIFMVVQSITIGFGQGFQPIIGYNYGAGRNDRVKAAVLFSLKICTAVLTVSAVVGFCFTPQIVAFFRDDVQVIAIGIRAFRFQCYTLPLGAILVFSNMLFQSMGKSWRASILAVCRQGLYIPMVFLLSSHFGLAGLELTQAVADLLAFFISSAILTHFFLREFGRE